MREWACSRLFGLGTKIPWDDGWVIESLSDSTIYMAYYTVCHVLQGSGSTNLDGSQEANFPASSLTPEVWDYIYQTNAPETIHNFHTFWPREMRAVPRYWYPMDLRVSGKDLIGSHLTMCLYNHAAIWPNESETWWPTSMYERFCTTQAGQDVKQTATS